MWHVWGLRRGGSRVAQMVLLGAAMLLSAAAAGAEWKPTDNVEVVVGASPGGGNDNIARTMQKIIHDERMVDVALNVVNKPGGGGAIAYTYLNQHAGNAHYLGISSNTLLTNQIIGKSQVSYRDLTPIAIMINEYITFSVKADSPLKTGRDMVTCLKVNPASVVFGISSSLGNINHIAVATVARAAGVDPKKLRVVVFSGSGKSITALLGGHIDVVAGPPSIALKNIEAGTLRALAVTAPVRLAGSLSGVPTWRELGIDSVVINWRGVVGPRGLTPEQVAYWDGIFRKVALSREWHDVLQKNQWENASLGSKEAGAYMKAQYDKFKDILMELGLAK